MENIEKLGLSGSSQGWRAVLNVFFEANSLVQHTTYSLRGGARLEVTGAGAECGKNLGGFYGRVCLREGVVVRASLAARGEGKAPSLPTLLANYWHFAVMSF
jgi:hypothetical protein